MSRKAARHKAPKPRGKHVAGMPNELELEYADTFLRPRKLAGEIRYTYEPEALRLCHRTTITIDWRVTILATGEVEWHEVKGWYCPEDGWIKLKFAASLYPDQKFFLCRKQRKAWAVKSVPNAPAGPLSSSLEARCSA